MDEISAFNQSKWDELASKGVIFSRPYLNLTPETARQAVDPQGLMGDLVGKRVLCLASAGGQQSAAFHVLGAHPVVIDLSEAMLQRDREVAEHYQAQIEIIQGDMRDLSRFGERSFDHVWHAYSINFIPDPRPVFREVARVLRPGGLYRVEFHNPFFVGATEMDWTGRGYSLRLAYIDGEEVQEAPWEFEDEQGVLVQMSGPRAFRHTLSTVINELAGLGFLTLGLWEEVGQDLGAAPGTYEHFTRIAPPWLTLWMVFRPDVMGQYRAP